MYSLTPVSPSLSFFLSTSYPLLRLPLPGTGPVEFTTGVRDYSIPSEEPQGDVGERPDWVGEHTHSYTLYLGVITHSEHRFLRHSQAGFTLKMEAQK